MKNLIYITTVSVLFSSCYTRIGDLNMVSNRNIDSSKEYVLLERNAVGKAKSKKKDVLERAIDNATEKHQGEYLMNVKIHVRKDGNKVRVEGDVWGFKPIEVQQVNPTTVNVQNSVTKKNELNNGDKVTFKSTGKLVEGTIIGINTNGAIVEFINLLGKPAKKEIPFEELTKIEK